MRCIASNVNLKKPKFQTNNWHLLRNILKHHFHYFYICTLQPTIPWLPAARRNFHRRHNASELHLIFIPLCGVIIASNICAVWLYVQAKTGRDCNFLNFALFWYPMKCERLRNAAWKLVRIRLRPYRCKRCQFHAGTHTLFLLICNKALGKRPINLVKIWKAPFVSVTKFKYGDSSGRNLYYEKL